MTAPDDDPYDVLGLSRNATANQIRRRYKRLAAEFHPDRNSAANAVEQFKRIVAAYSVLKDGQAALRSERRQQSRSSSDRNSAAWQHPSAKERPVNSAERVRREKFAELFAEALASGSDDLFGTRQGSRRLTGLLLGLVLVVYAAFWMVLTNVLGHMPGNGSGFSSLPFWLSAGLGALLICGPMLGEDSVAAYFFSPVLVLLGWVLLLGFPILIAFSMLAWF